MHDPISTECGMRVAHGVTMSRHPEQSSERVGRARHPQKQLCACNLTNKEATLHAVHKQKQNELTNVTRLNKCVNNSPLKPCSPPECLRCQSWWVVQRTDRARAASLRCLPVAHLS
jgi:hypothetical protein